MASYAVILRDARTLAQLARVVHWEDLRWTRRALELGEFGLRVHDDHWDASSHVDADRVVEIQRDGVFEYAGLLQVAELDELTGWWELGGLDLRQWLTHRVVVPPGGSEHDSQAGVAAETALRYYVNQQLLAPSAAARDIDAELSGITFVLEADQARGGTVSYNARYANLLTVAQALARAGDVWFDVGFQASYAGYVFQVHTWRDRTAGSAEALVFSAGRGNASELRYRVDRRNYRNQLYVLGQGTGTARTIVERGDAADVASHFRREGSLDSRNSTSTAALEADGDAKLAEYLGRVEQLQLQPHPTRAVYRDDWDLGDEVTISVARRDYTAAKRITEVEVTVDDEGETIGVTLGDPPLTLPRLLAAALSESRRAMDN